MNTDFRLSVGIFEHPKVQKLGRRLGDGGVLSYIKLLRFVAQNRPDGSLHGMDSDDIAIAGGYNGDGDFAGTLLAVRLLDGAEGSYQIHDWTEHNPFAAGAAQRSAAASNAANARWAKLRNAEEQNEHSADDATAQRSAPHGNTDGCDPHTQSMPGAMRGASNGNAPASLPTSQHSLPASNTSQPPAREPSGSSVARSEDPGPAVVALLCSAGVSAEAAAEIAADPHRYPPTAVRQQVEWLQYRKPNDPPAVLVSSIKGRWPQPKGAKQAAASAAKDDEFAARNRARDALKEQLDKLIGALDDGDRRQMENDVLAAMENKPPMTRKPGPGRDGMIKRLQRLWVANRYRIDAKQLETE